MNFKTFLALVTVAGVASLGVLGCSVDASNDVELPQPQTQDELTALARGFVGTFEWQRETSGGYVEVEKLTLKTNGKYEAMVESNLVDEHVACITWPCTLPENGTWAAYKVGEKTRIRLDPEGARPQRVYGASVEDQNLRLERDGQSSTLFRRAEERACVKTGCSGQICADGERFSRCDWVPQYACFRSARCERQADGACGFTMTAALSSCLANP